MFVVTPYVGISTFLWIFFGGSGCQLIHSSGNRIDRHDQRRLLRVTGDENRSLFTDH